MSNLEKELELEIWQLESKKLMAQTRLEELRKMDPVRLLAIRLHEDFCHHNHIDGCGWHYEINKGVHDWTRSGHVHWFERAQKVSAKLNGLGIDVDTVIEVSNIITGKK